MDNSYRDSIASTSASANPLLYSSTSDASSNSSRSRYAITSTESPTAVNESNSTRTNNSHFGSPPNLKIQSSGRKRLDTTTKSTSSSSSSSKRTISEALESGGKRRKVDDLRREDETVTADERCGEGSSNIQGLKLGTTEFLDGSIEVIPPGANSSSDYTHTHQTSKSSCWLRSTLKLTFYFFRLVLSAIKR